MAVDFARIILPRVPDLVTSSIWHTLGWTPESRKWDLKSTLLITMIRGIMTNGKRSITDQQRLSDRDPGDKPNQIIIDDIMPAPKDAESASGIRAALCRSIDEMKETGEEEYDIPPVLDVEGEWQAWTQDKKIKELAHMSKEEKYAAMMKETTTPATILYLHGGAYFLMDPKSHRRTAIKLAKLSGGRAFNVRYRLTPQNPFPAQLLDAFLAYLSLLYPPEGALHEPVKPEHIVFAGDSAGGNLALALMLLILHLHQTGQTKVQFHGREVEVPIPIGIATNSAWTDITRCMPSLQRNAHYDYLPPVHIQRSPSSSDSAPTTTTSPDSPASPSSTTTDTPIGSAPKDPAGPPPCPAWPSPPPRADLLVSGPMLCHPLVSPLAASVSQWRGIPNVYACVGEEMLADEGNVVVQRIVAAQALDNATGQRTEVGTVWEGYEAQPHVFAAMLEGSRVSERCFGGWGGFVRRAVVDGLVEGRGTWVAAPGMEESERDVSKLTVYTEEEVKRWMCEERDSRERKWREEVEREKIGGGR